MKTRGARTPKQLWPKTMLKKWLNISTKDSDFSADEVDANESEYEFEDHWADRLHDEESKPAGTEAESFDIHANDVPYKHHRRRKSETLRAQYIETNELRICTGTWNVGGKFPPDDLQIEDWLNLEEPADIYVLGLQEIVPLNAGNIFGTEDIRSVPKWEKLIRGALNKIRPVKKKFKSYSDPTSPSRFKPPEDAPAIILDDVIYCCSDSDTEDEIHPVDDVSFSSSNDADYVYKNNLDSIQALGPNFDKAELLSELRNIQVKKLTKSLSHAERIGLIWPEPQLDSLISLKSFKSIKSFKDPVKIISDITMGDILKIRKRRTNFVKIISKQMVGIHLSIWVRPSLRKHVQNLKVSTVGVGVMGYIGNKGSISMSMSIYQTLFCFICCHLTSGEKHGDELKRNADVLEIHRRTHFSSHSKIILAKSIYDHERIIWLGDLNYRINLPYERTHDLISRKEWSKLSEDDQLKKELRKGRTFDGWSEGILKFPPTYKYEFNSDNYIGEEPKVSRRNPAWCDRILSYGNGIRLVKYRRSELNLSDHRPVTAIFTAEVEVFCPKKLQRALIVTEAEIKDVNISESDSEDDYQ